MLLLMLLLVLVLVLLVLVLVMVLVLVLLLALLRLLPNCSAARLPHQASQGLVSLTFQAYL